VSEAAAMLNAYPAARPSVDDDALVLCVQECSTTAQACVACADACLAASDVADLAACVSAALVAADVASSTIRVISRQTGYDVAVARAMLHACEQACRACFDECRRHGLEYEHCLICAEACRRCGSASRRLYAELD
jgi:hypothetical protein